MVVLTWTVESSSEEDGHDGQKKLGVASVRWRGLSSLQIPWLLARR